MSEEDVIDLAPELRWEALEIIARHDYGPLYTPPSQRGTIKVPGVVGGVNRSGAAIDPETGMLYVGTYRLPFVVTVPRLVFGGVDCMKRRVFIALVGGVVAWPGPPMNAHQPSTPIVGFMSYRSSEESAHLVAAFHQGLQELGFIEGQNVTIEYRWAHGDYSRPPALAAELVAQRVDVLVAVGRGVSVSAAKAATSTIPIVFTGTDPVEDGLVESFNRPGGNATGYTIWTNRIESKRLGLLHELVPNVGVYGS